MRIVFKFLVVYLSILNLTYSSTAESLNSYSLMSPAGIKEIQDAVYSKIELVKNTKQLEKESGKILDMPETPITTKRLGSKLVLKVLDKEIHLEISKKWIDINSKRYKYDEINSNTFEEKLKLDFKTSSILSIFFNDAHAWVFAIVAVISAVVTLAHAVYIGVTREKCKNKYLDFINVMNRGHDDCSSSLLVVSSNSSDRAFDDFFSKLNKSGATGLERKLETLVNSCERNLNNAYRYSDGVAVDRSCIPEVKNSDIKDVCKKVKKTALCINNIKEIYESRGSKASTNKTRGTDEVEDVVPLTLDDPGTNHKSK